MPPDGDMRSQAIEAVRKHHAGQELKDMSILDVMPEFHKGSLYVVGWTGADGTKYQDNAIYQSGEWRVFINDEELIQFIGRTSHHDPLFVRLLRLTGIAGIIALIVTATICYLAVQDKKIPDVLSNALTAILGFYFATVVYESRKNGG